MKLIEKSDAGWGCLALIITVSVNVLALGASVWIVVVVLQLMGVL